MLIVKCILCLFLLIACPLFWGQAVSFVLDKLTQKELGLNPCLLGMLVFFTPLSLGGFILQITGRGLHAFSILALFILCVYAVVAMFILLFSKEYRSSLKKKINRYKTESRAYTLVRMLAFFVLLIFIFIRPLSISENNVMLEQVATNLYTKTLGSINPLTGQMQSLGMTAKMENLPNFYAWLSDVFSVSPEILLFYVISILVLFVLWQAIKEYAKYFFEDKDKGYFTFFMLLLLLFAGNAHMNPAYAILFEGYTGNAVFSMIILPECFILWLKMKKSSQWLLFAGMFLCMVLCACFFAGVRMGMLLMGMQLCLLLVSEFVFKIKNGSAK